MLHASWSGRGPADSSGGGVRSTMVSGDALAQFLLELFGGNVGWAWPSNCRAGGTVPDVWNLCLPWSSRSTLEKVNHQLKREIMARCELTFADKRREYRAWT